MNGSVRYRILMWLVWIQVALLPVSVFVCALPGPERIWRWNIAFWVLLAGYSLGFLLWPLSWGLLKSTQLKRWWIRLDFLASVLLLIPMSVLIYANFNEFVSEKDCYVLFREPVIIGNQPVFLGKNEGIFVRKQLRIPFYYLQRELEDWNLDNTLGYIFMDAKGDYGVDLIVFPIDSSLYHDNEKIIMEKPDTIYNRYSNGHGYFYMSFVYPGDFSRIKYWNSHSVEYFTSDDSEWEESISILFPDEEEKNPSDSSLVIFNRIDKQISFHKDTVHRMSPMKTLKIIRQLQMLYPSDTLSENSNIVY